MTPTRKHNPTSPKQAAKRRSGVDTHLDPELFKALADPTRANLLACLIKCGRPCSVTEVAECCSVDFSMVARHLGALARAGVCTAEKQGRTVWYRAGSAELAGRFRAIADAIDEWPASPCCDPGCESDCGC